LTVVDPVAPAGAVPDGDAAVVEGACPFPARAVVVGGVARLDVVVDGLVVAGGELFGAPDPTIAVADADCAVVSVDPAPDADDANA
jgi:hypothetical protein